MVVRWPVAGEWPRQMGPGERMASFHQVPKLERGHNFRASLFIGRAWAFGNKALRLRIQLLSTQVFLCYFLISGPVAVVRNFSPGFLGFWLVLYGPGI